MEFDGDVLTIDLGMSMEEIKGFEEFIRPRIEYIETIEIAEGGAFASSALLALLVSIKRTRPDIAIGFLDKAQHASPHYGTIHWKCHD
jgi:hypothetical protein